MMFACPCCFHRTIERPASFEICPICSWEDDGQGEADADVVRGGPNKDFSLTAARINYWTLGASDPDAVGGVRPPHLEEIPPNFPRAGPRPDIEVVLTFLPTKLGGRTSPAFDAYRPQFHYDGNDYDASHMYPEVEAVEPGQTTRAFLTFVSPERLIGKIERNASFLIREGSRVVAYGCVRRTLLLDASSSA